MATTINRTSEAGSAPPRERILNAARDLFYRHGIRAVGVETILALAEESVREPEAERWASGNATAGMS